MNQISLIDLDLLLDTTLATISKINPTAAVKIVDDDVIGKRYRTRLNNDFQSIGVSAEEFAKAFARRNVETLKLSRPTKFLFELKEVAYDLIKLKVYQPHAVDKIEFRINFYPYSELDAEERVEILNAIGARLQDIVFLRAVYIPPEELTQEYLAGEEINNVYLTDVMQWIGTQFNEHTEQQNVTYTPGLNINGCVWFANLDQLGKAIEYKNDNGDQCDPVTGLRMMFSPYFTINPIDAGTVSIASNDVIVENL
jgi:hypothetical protein